MISTDIQMAEHNDDIGPIDWLGGNASRACRANDSRS